MRIYEADRRIAEGRSDRFAADMPSTGICGERKFAHVA
jgi:hypothetical protein